MSLNYYDGDFAVNTTTSPTPGTDYIHKVGTLTNNLYNGNISSWQQVHNNLYNTTLPPNQEIKDAQMMNRINVFDYDISGRLDSSEIRTVVSGSISPLTAANSYSSKYQYDLNGNIMSMNRVSDQPSATTTTQTSSFQTYTDNSSKVRPMNRLTQVTNTSTGIPKLYMYDNMGNILSKFDANNPNSDFKIVWTADGKIDTVMKLVIVPDKHNPTVMLPYWVYTSYYYDGMGNKVMTVSEVDSATVNEINLRCNNDSSMLALYNDCVECVDALGLKATYYGMEAGGKTLALYDTDPERNVAFGLNSCNHNYKYIWLDDWYVYGSEADGRIATVDPKEIIAVNGSRMTGSEFPHPLNEYNASPPPDNLLPTAMRDTNIFGMNASYRVQQRTPDFRRYEIKDHLGSVRTVIADYKNPDPTTTASSMQFWRYKADVKNISNMYPYGKSYGTNAIYNKTDDYRYGFNGKEKELVISEVSQNLLYILESQK